ncbi:MAG: hypothetical protein GY868_17945, partial [Deltaproteobacteria bacterium]|nr:hypothetical protein [Deltaproteobacteria bacterium]
MRNSTYSGYTQPLIKINTLLFQQHTADGKGLQKTCGLIKSALRCKGIALVSSCEHDTPSFSDSLPLDHLHQMLDELTKAQKPASASFAQTIRTADVAQDISPANRQKALQADCRWMLYAPLSTEQKLLGHLVLHYSDRPTLT